jgi:NADH-quinone oxidoreductase subunit G
LGAIDQVADNGWTALAPRDMGDATLRTVYKGYYLTNPIARASATMGELAAMEAGRAAPQMAAE